MLHKGGFTGNLLRIDLSNKTSKLEHIPEETLAKYVGGRGLGAKILFDEVPAGTNPLSPENKLIFSAGPLTGTTFPTSARSVVVTKSPQTNAYLYSMGGGKFGLNLKKAGFDSLVIEGKSDEPIYIVITDGKVDFRKADHIWGMKTEMAFHMLHNALDRSYTLVINGPAGDNLVPMAGLMTDDFRQFGRGGAGAVLGSKNVKAIALKGTSGIGVADEAAFKENLKTVYELLKKQPGVSQNFPRYGSGENLKKRSDAGNLPTRNWSKCTFDKSWDISMISMRDEKGMVSRDQGCWSCPLQCGKLTKTVSREFLGYHGDGPEYETLYALGSNIEIGDPNFVVAANAVCDDLGLDTMSAGITLGFAIECFEKGFLTEQDLGGRKIGFGKTDHLLSILEDMAFRRGIGELLCLGTKRAAEKIGKGSEQFAMHVKGLEIGGYDPRTAKGQAVVLAAGNRGGCHHSIGLTAVAEVNQGIGQQIDGKGAMVKRFSRVRLLSDSVPNCTFAFSRTFDYDLWGKILTAATGTEWDAARLQDTADRINTQERMFNLREGFTVADDNLPKRLTRDPLPDGPGKGEIVTEEQLVKMRTEYFLDMGWDESGVPKKETLLRLGLI